MRRCKILFVICLSFMISYLISSEIKKLSEKDTQFYYEQCKIDFAAGKIDEAIKNGEMAVELDGTKPDYYFHLAIACDEKLKHASGLNALYYAKKLKKNIEKAVILDSKNIEYRTMIFSE